MYICINYEIAQLACPKSPFSKDWVVLARATLGRLATTCQLDRPARLALRATPREPATTCQRLATTCQLDRPARPALRATSREAATTCQCLAT